MIPDSASKFKAEAGCHRTPNPGASRLLGIRVRSISISHDFSKIGGSL